MHASFGDHQLRPELFGLRVSAGREFLTGDACWKSEVIFDLGTRTGLPSGRVGFQHQHIQAFRRCVHCRRKAGRSRAYDDNIADLRLIDGVVEAKAVRDLFVAWVAKHYFAATYHNGDVR